MFDCTVLVVINRFFYQTKVHIDARALLMLGTKYRAFYVEAHYNFCLHLMLDSCIWPFLFFFLLARFTRSSSIFFFRRQEPTDSTAEFFLLAVFCVALLLTFGHKSVCCCWNEGWRSFSSNIDFIVACSGLTSLRSQLKKNSSKHAQHRGRHMSMYSWVPPTFFCLFVCLCFPLEHGTQIAQWVDRIMSICLTTVVWSEGFLRWGAPLAQK